MYRRTGMSGPFDFITNAIKQIVGGVRVSVPSVNVPLPGGITVSRPATQTGAPAPPQTFPSQTPDWLMPVALGGAALLVVMMMTKGRK